MIAHILHEHRRCLGHGPLPRTEGLEPVRRDDERAGADEARRAGEAVRLLADGGQVTHRKRGSQRLHGDRPTRIARHAHQQLARAAERLVQRAQVDDLCWHRQVECGRVDWRCPCCTGAGTRLLRHCGGRRAGEERAVAVAALAAARSAARCAARSAARKVAAPTAAARSAAASGMASAGAGRRRRAPPPRQRLQEQRREFCCVKAFARRDVHAWQSPQPRHRLRLAAADDARRAREPGIAESCHEVRAEEARLAAEVDVLVEGYDVRLTERRLQRLQVPVDVPERKAEKAQLLLLSLAEAAADGHVRLQCGEEHRLLHQPHHGQVVDAGHEEPLLLEGGRSDGQGGRRRGGRRGAGVC